MANRVTFEKRKIIEAMSKEKADVSEIAKATGLSIYNIYYEYKRVGLDKNNRKNYSAQEAQNSLL